MPRALVGLGSNLADRESAIREARKRLAALPRTREIAASRLYETTAVGGPAGQPDYLNAAVTLETTLEPHALLAALAGIEHAMGRRRSARWEPRPIDLDLLLYGKLHLDLPGLVVPHPRMMFRRFVLEPAAEVAGDWVHPEIRQTVQQLLDHLNTTPNYVALVGQPANVRKALARRLAEAVDGILVEEQNPEKTVAPGDDDPSGSAAARSIQFLGRQASLMAQLDWRKPARWVISDLLLEAKRAPAPVDWELVKAYSKQLRPSLDEAKLVVVVNPLANSMEELALRFSIGHLLRVPDAGDEAFEEVLAAMRATQ